MKKNLLVKSMLFACVLVLGLSLSVSIVSASSTDPGCGAVGYPTGDKDAPGYDQSSSSTNNVCALRSVIGDKIAAKITDPNPWMKWHGPKYYRVETASGNFWINMLDVRSTDTLPFNTTLVWDKNLQVYVVDGRGPASTPTPEPKGPSK